MQASHWEASIRNKGPAYPICYARRSGTRLNSFRRGEIEGVTDLMGEVCGHLLEIEKTRFSSQIIALAPSRPKGMYALPRNHGYSSAYIVHSDQLCVLCNAATFGKI